MRGHRSTKGSPTPIASAPRSIARRGSRRFINDPPASSSPIAGPDTAVAPGAASGPRGFSENARARSRRRARAVAGDLEPRQHPIREVLDDAILPVQRRVEHDLAPDPTPHPLSHPPDDTWATR